MNGRFCLWKYFELVAYIPDQAILDSGDISKTAFRLFCFYCKFGSMTTNRVTVSLRTATSFLGIAYENTTRLHRELRDAGWIKTVDGATILLKGRTDENISSNKEQLTKTSVATDENISSQLTKTSVAYKEEPAFLNQKEESGENASRFVSRRPKPHPVPIDFVADADQLKWAKKNAPNVDAIVATANFVRFFRARGDLLVDWNARWEMWILQDQKHYGQNQRSEPKRLPTAEELERENAAERADRSNWVYPTPRNDQEPRPIIDRPSR